MAWVESLIVYKTIPQSDNLTIQLNPQQGLGNL